MSMRSQHTNTENETISLQDVMLHGHTPVTVIAIHDDPPPHGTGQVAPHLLDAGTRAWLREQLDILDREDEP